MKYKKPKMTNKSVNLEPFKIIHVEKSKKKLILLTQQKKFKIGFPPPCTTQFYTVNVFSWILNDFFFNYNNYHKCNMFNV